MSQPEGPGKAVGMRALFFELRSVTVVIQFANVNHRTAMPLSLL